MTSADFNGDGRDDILWRHESGLVTTWLGNADGSFVNNHANSAVSVPTDWQVVGLGDFNGDGFGDVLWRHDSGLVTNWLGSASGAFVNNHALSAAWVPTDWTIIGTGDFNDDGFSDVLWRHSSGLVTNWLGTASGSFVNNHANSAAFQPNAWVVTGVGDFNGDGNSDILWQDGRFITNWLGNDQGGFIPNDAAALARLNFIVSANGDFNGDGRDDILVVDDWQFGSAFFARADGSFDLDNYDPFVDAIVVGGVAAVGDFDGNGADDILWRSGATLALSRGFSGPGDNLVTDPNFAPTVPTSWQVQPNVSGFGYWDY